MHLTEVVNGLSKSKKARWVANILLNRQSPTMLILDIVSGNESKTRENEWIRKYSANDLVNGVTGGGGARSRPSLRSTKTPRQKYMQIHRVGDTISLEDIDGWLVFYREKIEHNY